MDYVFEFKIFYPKTNYYYFQEVIKKILRWLLLFSFEFDLYFAVVWSGLGSKMKKVTTSTKINYIKQNRRKWKGTEEEKAVPKENSVTRKV